MGVEIAFRRCKSSYIKVIKWLLILSLLVPINVKANLKTQEPEEIQPGSQDYLTRPSDEVVNKLWQEYQTAQAQSQITSTNYATHKSCVQIAKEYLGVYGTWGSGGRGLSFNSGPVIDAVVIFAYIHVGVIKDVAYGQILLYEGNYDNRGSIRTRWISASDPIILGFHKF